MGFEQPPHGIVIAVAAHASHGFSKTARPAIRLLAGLGVEGDAHQGATVRHRSQVRRDPARPNLRQVHLLQSELFAELAARGFALEPGGMGENISTQGIDLLSLPRGTESVHRGRGRDSAHGFAQPLLRNSMPTGPDSWRRCSTARRTAVSSARPESWVSC